MRTVEAVVRILEVDPELAAGIPHRELARARATLLCPIKEFTPGEYSAANIFAHSAGVIAAMLLDGLIAHKVTVSHSTSVEVIGAGEMLFRPPEADAGAGDAESWAPLTRAQVAIIDAAFMARCSSWPAVQTNLLTRIAQQNRRAVVQQAIGHIVGVEHRIHVALWHFAERWGRVRSDGVRLLLPMTNVMLGCIVGASAPSVSSAVGSLLRSGAIAARTPDGGWLLDPKFRPHDANHARATVERIPLPRKVV